MKSFVGSTSVGRSITERSGKSLKGIKSFVMRQDSFGSDEDDDKGVEDLEALRANSYLNSGKNSSSKSLGSVKGLASKPKKLGNMEGRGCWGDITTWQT
eukprot:1141337-Pelagomonas_calceolata.AAC.1